MNLRERTMRSAARNNQFEGLQKGGYQIKFRWYEWYEWSEWISHFLEKSTKKSSSLVDFQVSRYGNPDGPVQMKARSLPRSMVKVDDRSMMKINQALCVFFLARIKSQVSPQINMIQATQKVNNIIQAWKFVWKEWMMETLNSIIFSSFVCLLITPPLLVKR